MKVKFMEKNMNDEMEGVELARRTLKFAKCNHELVTKRIEDLTFDGRKRVYDETRCVKCGLYRTVKMISEEAVSSERSVSC